MNVLIVSATEAEIAPFTEYMQNATLRNGVSGGLLFTGVGMLNAAYELTKHLQHGRYDLVLQVGVAGSYGRDIAPGKVVFVTVTNMATLVQKIMMSISIFLKWALSIKTHALM